MSATRPQGSPKPARSWDDVRAERPPHEESVAEHRTRMMRERDEADVLRPDADAMSDIAGGDAAYSDGDVVRGADEVRRLRS